MNDVVRMISQSKRKAHKYNLVQLSLKGYRYREHCSSFSMHGWKQIAQLDLHATKRLAMKLLCCSSCLPVSMQRKITLVRSCCKMRLCWQYLFPKYMSSSKHLLAYWDLHYITLGKGHSYISWTLPCSIASIRGTDMIK